jgi:hypothetical protein
MTTQTESTSDTGGRISRLPLIGLLVIQVLIGYEWFMSGLTKVVDGGFTSGLAKELRGDTAGDAHWYASFLRGSVIPHATAFGYLIELGELLVGAGLIVAAVFWLFRWERLSDAGRVAVLVVTALSALGGVAMAVNFHLASGAPHPWLIPRSGFDESVDLDSLLPMLQVVLIGVSVGLLRSLRRAAPGTSTVHGLAVAVQGGETETPNPSASQSQGLASLPN